MDALKKSPSRGHQPTLRVWQPRSRIAGYIKGEVKLEDIVRGDKLVKPEHRHNKRAFLLHLNEECSRKTGDAKAGSRNSSRICRCPSSAQTSASEVTVPDTDHSIQKNADKSEQISRLQRQIETIRDCVHKTEVQEGEDVETAVSTLLDCLVNLSTALRNVDATDDRIAAFANRVQRERQRWFTFATSLQDEVGVLRNLNENLQISNNKRDECMHAITGENTRLQTKFSTLQTEFERLRECNEKMTSVYESIIANKNDTIRRNEKLRDGIAEYERVYEKTAKELSQLSELSDRVRLQFEIEKRELDAANLTTCQQVAELEEKIRKLEDECRTLENSKCEMKSRAAEIEKRHQSEIQTLKEANDKYVKSLTLETSSLEREVTQLRDDERSLRQENDNLRATLLQLSNKCRILNEDAEYAKCEKKTLEEAFRSINKSSDVTQIKENLNNKLLELEEKRLGKLMQYLEDTIKCTEKMPEKMR